MSTKVIAINAYYEYGIPAVTNTGRFGYTGQTWLPEIGMNYYKARMYSPTLGRFMQPDPIGYGDGMNLYAYVGGDPVNFSDPSGLCQNYTDVYRREWRDGRSIELFRVNYTIGCGSEAGSAPNLHGNLVGEQQGEEGNEIVVTGAVDRNTVAGVSLLSAGVSLLSQRGGNNVGSSEFANMSDLELQKAYKKSKGKQRLKVQAELKNRNLKNSRKFRGGGIREVGPIIIFDFQLRIIFCNVFPNDPICGIA